METYQALEAMYVIRGVVAQDAMNFFTLLSAYLIVAYLVGSKLSTFQVWAISVLYTAFCAGPIAGFYVGVVDLGAINHADGGLYAVEHTWIVPLIMVLSWVLSIVFMVDARSRSRGKADRSEAAGSVEKAE